MALDPDCDEGIIEEIVPTPERRELAQDRRTEAEVSESIENLMAFMPSIADQFMQSVQAAAHVLSERVREKAHSTHDIQSAKNEFVSAMLEAGSQFMSQRMPRFLPRNSWIRSL